MVRCPIGADDVDRLRGALPVLHLAIAGGLSPGVERLGQVGYISKGVAMAVVGGLFGWAALTYDPSKAGGLDDALRTINSAPLGSVLLTVVALGLACFGVFCFFWARHPKIDAGTGSRSGETARTGAAGAQRA